MKKPNGMFLLFVVIVLEGYVVLSAELLAIRQTIPYVGTGTDTVSIIIAAVLMPLAVGYFAGGQFKPGFINGSYKTVRGQLIRNILIAAVIFLIGLSYPTLTWFFETLIDLGIYNRQILISIYSLVFLVTPVYLLGQTIPLVSNYFSKEKLSQITGRILFFSTFGSFMGAVFSTIVLMAMLGVHHTVSIIFIILCGLVVILSKKKFSFAPRIAFALTLFALIMNSDALMDTYDIVENNQYNTIIVKEKKGTRYLILNGNYSVKYNDAGDKTHNIELVEFNALGPIQNTKEPKNILVIGAGGFTFGAEDLWNYYDYVDIDGALKEVAEEHILKFEVTKNKEFHPIPARAYLTKTDKKYDVIFLDVFQGAITLPEHLATREFFMQVKDRLKENGHVFGNFVVSPNFKSKISRNLDNTWRSVFPHSSRVAVRSNYHAWNDDPRKIVNVVYVYRHYPDEDPTTIYTDNKNPIFYDRP